VISNRLTAQRVRPLLVGGASLVAGVLIWWAVAALTGIPSYILPTPGSVVNRAVELFAANALQIHIAQTVAEVLQGGLLGAVIGIVLAMVFAHVGWIQRLLMPLIVVAQVTPKISIAPLIVLWLGLGIGSKITLITLVVFYPVLINMLSRLNAIPSTLKDLARITGMGPVRRAFRIEFPFSLPALAAGLKLGLLQGVTAAVIGEFIGAKAGLGYLEKQGQDNADIRLVIITLMLLALIGYLLYAVVTLIEKRIVRRFD
jgi:NitT/TauT family transport system permease protein